MTPDEERIARTESIFRHVNERIAETAEEFDSEDSEFVCECADPNCHHRVEVPLDEYEEVREDGAQFIVAEGHEVPAYEKVVERRTPYLVVKKFGRALARAVRRSDPRTETV